jgi:hypothetical protein
MKLEHVVVEDKEMDKETKEVLDELKTKLPINQFQLELECTNQPSLLAEVGEIASAARAEAKRSKEHLEYVRADLSTKIRKNPETYGLSKATEGAIDSAVTLQKEYQEASSKAIDDVQMADLLSIFQSSVEQRKSLIRDLVSLYIYNYYSNQNLSKEGGSAGGVTEEQILNARNQNAKERGEDRVEREIDEEKQE